MVMASPCLCSSASLSSLVSLSHPRSSNFCFPTWIPQLGLTPFSSWTGLKHLGVSVTPKSLTLGKKNKCNRMVVHASLFGVGAPEALVIGVVALLVFGPKGLAEVARNLGKTLRAFQPTIRELQDVSREFKNTLEREIGLEDVSSSMQNTYNPHRDNISTPPVASPNDSKDVADPKIFYSARAYQHDSVHSNNLCSSGQVEVPFTQCNPQPPISLIKVDKTLAKSFDLSKSADGSPSPNRAYTSDEYLKITEEQLKASAAQQQAQSQLPPQEESRFEPQTQHQAAVKEPTSASPPPPQKPENQT